MPDPPLNPNRAAAVVTGGLAIKILVWPTSDSRAGAQQSSYSPRRCTVSHFRASSVAMSSLRAPVVKNIVRSGRPLLPHAQRRWAQVHDVRYLTTHHDSNRVIDRYKDKLDRKAKQEGYSSISALQEAYQDKIKDLKTKAESIPQPVPSTSQSSSASPSPETHSPTTAQSTQSIKDPSSLKSQTPGIKPLSSYIDIEKILTLPAKEIETLWRLRHAANSRSICAAIPIDTYLRIVATARQNPQFVLPLPRTAESSQPDEMNGGSAAAAADPTESASTGADIHFLQWAFHPPAGATTSPPAPTTTNASPPTLNTHTSTVLFTHLASYKLHGAYSQPHTIITHHLDLADKAGLVLMNGSVVEDRGVSVDEAKLLVMWLQRFYDWGADGKQAGKKADLVRMFTQGDVNGFKLEYLMEEAQRI
ncbi:ATP synthase mitochondrial F1 complex assembly factor 1 [Blastomyces parvus]|uniref:ATP synthase mitochondrial F1 complex assembly factor 1 n=1 Tax=Blastomyces parvus TaxID=2060905 RepID=A0A2B7WRD1_9EURO|nr:ATP synthase mitochondrial F1 complex assembly factor 1 [Blastomyces parvus]